MDLLWSLLKNKCPVSLFPVLQYWSVFRQVVRDHSSWFRIQNPQILQNMRTVYAITKLQTVWTIILSNAKKKPQPSSEPHSQRTHFRSSRKKIFRSSSPRHTPCWSLYCKAPVWNSAGRVTSNRSHIFFLEFDVVSLQRSTLTFILDTLLLTLGANSFLSRFWMSSLHHPTSQFLF